ncbi:MAG: hypothetical protein ACRED1_03560 [Limisphaerales bacterium]
MKTNVSRKALVAAYAIALSADLIEICFFPLFSAGFAFPPDDVLDVVVCLILSRLIGFHLAFLPSFLIKIIPLVETAPTWTIAVLIASRHFRPTVVDVPSVIDAGSGGGGIPDSEARRLK